MLSDGLWTYFVDHGQVVTPVTPPSETKDGLMPTSASTPGDQPLLRMRGIVKAFPGVDRKSVV